MLIAEATSQDRDTLLELLRGYYAEAASAPPADRIPVIADGLLSRGHAAGSVLLARREDGKAVGFAVIHWVWSTDGANWSATLNDLYVAPAARGSGLAERLIEAARDTAAEKGAGRLMWRTRPQNVRAQRVYDRVAGPPSDWLFYSVETGVAGRRVSTGDASAAAVAGR